MLDIFKIRSVIKHNLLWIRGKKDERNPSSHEMSMYSNTPADMIICYMRITRLHRAGICFMEFNK